MRRPWTRLAAGLVAALAAAAASAGHSRVDGNRVIATGFPAGTITVDAGLEYLASEEFVLYGIADCEIHLFAASEGGRVQRLLWIQFEGYLPSVRSTYDYSSSPRQTEIGGHLFYDDFWAYDYEAFSQRWRKGSDSEHVAAMVTRAGLRLGPDLMSLRLVRLDPERRKELMIIYIEDLADQGLTAAELAAEEAAAAREELAEGLRERALAAFGLDLE